MNTPNFIKLSGLSGIMRVRNEDKYVEACIESCIDSLDELIVVYTGCTDRTEDILKRKVNEYPQKLRIFKYEHDILWFGLNQQEYEFAMNLQEDSPLLYCNLCNFALSKARYKYAVKIDSDQIYYSDELRKWRDTCYADENIKIEFSFIIGMFFMTYFSIYRRISAKLGKPCSRLIPNKLVKICFPSYIKFAKWCLTHDKAAIALSGVNVFIDGQWYIPFDGVNIHPPYNGEGDTLIFKVSERTFYTRHSSNTSMFKTTFSVTEDFNHPYLRIMFAGPMWFHLHANRAHCFSNVKLMKTQRPDLFVLIKDFLNMSYEEVLQKMDSKSHSLFQRTLFALIHKVGISTIKKNLYIIDKYKQ